MSALTPIEGHNGWGSIAAAPWTFQAWSADRGRSTRLGGDGWVVLVIGPRHTWLSGPGSPGGWG